MRKHFYSFPSSVSFITHRPAPPLRRHRRTTPALCAASSCAAAPFHASPCRTSASPHPSAPPYGAAVSPLRSASSFYVSLSARPFLGACTLSVALPLLTLSGPHCASPPSRRACRDDVLLSRLRRAAIASSCACSPLTHTHTHTHTHSRSSDVMSEGPGAVAVGI